MLTFDPRDTWPVSPARMWMGEIIDQLQAADMDSYPDRLMVDPLYRKAPREASPWTADQCAAMLKSSGGDGWTGD
jgi:hypothetical protein